MFGAWFTALVMSLANAPLLLWRARCEARALEAGATLSAP
jgi:isoprenylcysteine carboxyl methyltransferase (ICMT) family protein YpbQ